MRPREPDEPSGRGHLQLSLRASSAVLLFAALAPRALSDGAMRWAWQGLSGRPASELLPATTAIVVAGLVLSASFARLPRAALARLSLWVVGIGYVATSAQMSLSPSAFSVLPSPAVVAVALIAVAVHVGSAHRGARGLWAFALLASLLYYLWPSPARAPLVRLVHVGSLVLKNGSVWQLASASLLAVVVLSPSLLLGLAWLQQRNSVSASKALGPTLALYSVPMLLLPFALRSLEGRRGGLSSLLELAVEVLGATAMLIWIGQAAAFVTSEQRQQPATPALRSARPLVAGVGLVLASCLPSLLGKRALEPWQLDAPSARADALFGAMLPRWNDARAKLDLSHGATAGATTGEERLLIARGRELDVGLGGALGDLVRAASAPGVSEHEWQGWVAQVNRESRRARLPYYVAHSGTLVRTRTAARWFRLDSYRIERTSLMELEQQNVDVIELRSLTPKRTSSATLGLSSDSEPVALVLLDAIEVYANELRALSTLSPPRCVRQRGRSSQQESALVSCGNVLGHLARSSSLFQELRRGVIRHELQHQVDRGAPPIAKTLELRSRERGVAVPPRINRELSAYLAELAGPAPHLSLVRLLRLATIDARQVDGAAAQLALELVAGRSGADRTSSEVAFAELVELSAEQLRERAAATWKRELGRELGPPMALP